jgi:uncharacterized protein YgiM (DUF1202 family)
MARFRMMLAFIGVMLLSWVVVNAQGVRAVVVNEFANIRLVPAIGAEVLGSVSAGYEFNQITGRTGDNQWLRVIFNNAEGWVNVTPLIILSGDVNSLPLADPRLIPYGTVDAPRAGLTSKNGAVFAQATNGLRIRSGPSQAYPTIGNINRNQQMTLTGRTATTGWYQVSFQGVLGWVSSQFVQINNGDVNTLPIDGIVAEAPINIGSGEDARIDILRLMLDRVNNAQPSLDIIRSYWTDSALTGRASCQPYPAQPSDIQLPQPVLARYFDQLEPLRVDINNAMFNVRQAIDLFIQVCNQPGTGNPVGRATVEGALGIVNLAQSQLDSLRERIIPLIPPPIGSDQCLLTFNGRSEVLPLIRLDTIYVDNLDARNYARGYCFDGINGQQINLQLLPLPGSTGNLFVSISPLDAPTQFLIVNRTAPLTRTLAGPITINRSTRYLVLVANTDGTVPQGRFALYINSIILGVPQSYLAFDTNTQAVLLTVNIATTILGTNLGNIQLTATAVPPPTAEVTGTPGAGNVVCPSTSFACSSLFNCAEARACLAAGNFSLDPDNDGIPCEEGVAGGAAGCTP